MTSAKTTSSPTVVDGYVPDFCLPELLSGWFALLRESLLDVTSGSVCVATMQAGSELIEIGTPRRLSENQVKQIKTHLHGTGKNLLQQKRDIRITINAVDESDYEYESHKTLFAETVLLPLFVQKAPAGSLIVCNFNTDTKLEDSALIKEFQNEISSTLTFLWQLNQDEREKYESLVLSAIDGIILCTLDRKIKFINGAALRLLREDTSEHFIGQPLSALSADYLTEFLEEAFGNGLHEVNKVIQAPMKRLQLVGVHTELLKNSFQCEIGWMIVLRDVTTTWHNDQMRSALTVASHEIKTPLNSMTGALDTLLEQDFGDINEQQQRCLEIIKDDVERLNRLLTDILDLSRFEEGVTFIDRRREISLGYLVNKVVHSFRMFAQSKNINIQNKIPKTIPTFRGDRDRLQQVFSNLLENAIKYSYPNNKIEIYAEVNNSVLRFWIKDEGVGIPEEAFDLIFEKFNQLDNYPDHTERGYGLGLSIAKEIVVASGGRIWVDSKVGEGSTFYITIPV